MGTVSGFAAQVKGHRDGCYLVHPPAAVCPPPQAPVPRGPTYPVISHIPPVGQFLSDKLYCLFI